MKKIWSCRRSMLGLIGMSMLLAIALVNKVDTSMAIASIAMGVAAANAAQGTIDKKSDQ